MGLDICNNLKIEATLVADEFIDKYMVSANGEYIKVYLFLLRHGIKDVTISVIAEALNHTEADVKRALSYWEKLGILRGSAGIAEDKGQQDAVSPAWPVTCTDKAFMAEGSVTQGKELNRLGADVCGESKPEVRRPSFTQEQVNKLTGDEDFAQLLYIAQKYMNKVFTHRECEVFAYLYGSLHMSSELLEYLVEYCVQGGHSNIRYIETVALNWHQTGLTTVDMAKSYSTSFTKDSFAVMRAFGLNDRKPGESEKDMISRWFHKYCFTRELVLEACNRTMEATHTPSFKYADKILSEWKKAGVKNMEDVKRLDEKRYGNKGSGAGRKASPVPARSGKNQFHNFQQRDTDYDALILHQLKEQ